MDTTHADLREGTRHDIAVEFVTRRSITVEGERIHGLTVEDETGEQFRVLVTPDADPLLDLKTDAAYWVWSLLGADPLDADGENECPDCGHSLRRGQVVDAYGPAMARAVAEFGIDGSFGVVDERTAVEKVGRDGVTVDDWRPMSVDDVPAGPDHVCDACGRPVSDSELRRPQREERFEDDVEACYAPEPAGDEMVMENLELGSPDAGSETVGMATGGTKDVTNFRENVANGYTPQPEAITDEGLFYDYHFETGEETDSEALFAPRYATAVSEHPLSNETEQFLSVGLDSTLSVEDFERPRLDLVAVLDVSGSMGGAFDSYYYDEHGNRQSTESGVETKMEAATESLCALTQQLDGDDRLGVVLYNNRSHVAKPLRDVASTDMEAIRRHVRELECGGGTNLEDGFRAAVELLADGTEARDVERRVVFTTDMMPNTGATGENQLTELFTDAATEGIHTTFVGMGLDANADLTETLSGIRGANSYFVHSAEEFERRLGEEFDYMVTPLVYDLGLELDAEGYEIAAVHGSPSADPHTGRLMHVGTLFPSPKRDGEARGGVVLVRLERTRAVQDSDLDLLASWTERGGSEHVERVSVDIPDETGTYAHSGIHKAVALSRYARELRTWAEAVHAGAVEGNGVDDWIDPDPRGDHERESVPLTVDEDHAERFRALESYLEAEMAALGDEELQRELDLLETLCEAAPSAPTEVTD
jgi:Ca-activated chloride channel family protein